MSRTKKDVKSKYRDDVCNNVLFWLPTAFAAWGLEGRHPKFRSVPKLRKHKDFTYHWMSTPSWWTKVKMNRPMRRKLKQALHTVSNLEEFDEGTGYSKKPHRYYW